MTSVRAQNARHLGRSFLKDSDGAVAIELAMVSVPFLTMMFAVINTGMFFFAINCLDRGMEDASRYIRTGEAQGGKVAGYAGSTGQGMTAAQFKKLVCDRASGYIDCTKLEITIQSSTDANGGWANINPTVCMANGSLTTGNVPANANPNVGPTISGIAGTQGAVVLITACYKWEMGRYLPFVHFDRRFTDGSSLIQSSTALRIEPYT